MRLVWTTTALRRLDENAQRIADDNPDRARAWVDEVFAKVEGLTDFPEVGRIVPELGKPHVRELLSANYRV
jgi:plasmid stabilization system protein ParE